MATVSLLIVGTIALPAAAEAPEGPAHVALGDSIAAGSVANSPNTGYVQRLNRYLRSVDCNDSGPAACPHLELVDFSVGGAKSQDLIDVQLGPAVAEIVARASDGDPNNDVEFITVTIGGNDLFRPVIEACAGGASPTCIATIQSIFMTYQANLGTVLGTLRAVAPDAEIAIMTYDNPIGTCFLSDLDPLADEVLEGVDLLPFGLNDIIRGVAAATGVSVVETYGLLDDADFVGGDDCLHPDDSGHRKIAKEFFSVMR
jgi:lysophospholipase L1-like esterase